MSKDNNPGPGSYKLRTYFEFEKGVKFQSRSKNMQGKQSTILIRLDPMNLQIKAAVPGPGNYKLQGLSPTGKYASSLNSNSLVPRIMPSGDRFTDNKSSRGIPGPGSYSPRENHVTSNHKFPGSIKYVNKITKELKPRGDCKY